jgi:hypothetical protein
LKLSTSFRFAAAILIVLGATSAMAKDNPSERYANAYKKYADATCPIKADGMRHFVYFARDRDAIHDHAFLTKDRFLGAQIMYSWKNLETEEGQYDFSTIQADVDYLAQHGKRLFIQLQDGSFSPDYKPVPEYLLTRAYEGGVAAEYSEDGTLEGWVAKRWNPAVQTRFAALLTALGTQFDGKIEGINLQESAIEVTPETDPSFAPSLYAESLKVNMLALKSAFPISTTMIYANFMPGEWLPWEDHGYLRGIYEFGDKNGIGIGAPDLMVQRKGQLNHALAMMHEHSYSVPLGIAVQDGNYIGTTASDEVVTQRPNLVPALHAFAQDFLKVTYMFWVNQAPYFEEDVLPCFDNR